MWALPTRASASQLGWGFSELHPQPNLLNTHLLPILGLTHIVPGVPEPGGCWEDGSRGGQPPAGFPSLLLALVSGSNSSSKRRRRSCGGVKQGPPRCWEMNIPESLKPSVFAGQGT